MNKGVTYEAEDIGEGDDRQIFFTKMFSGQRVVIIQKERFELSETPTTYVLTVKKI